MKDPEAIARIKNQLEQRGEALSELDKFGEVALQFSAVAAFVEWLRGNGMEIGLVPVLPGAQLIPLTSEHPEQFAAAFYDINYHRLCEDRAEFIRQYNEEQ